MGIRFLNDVGDIIINANRKDLIAGIKATSGRVIVGETVAFKTPLIDGVTNIELLKSFGVDMVTINHYNVDMPQIPGLDSTEEGIAQWGAAWNVNGSKGCFPDPKLIEDSQLDHFITFGYGRQVGEIKRLVGIPVGTTLDPITENGDLPKGRLATVENARKTIEQGASYVAIVQTPRTNTQDLLACVSNIRMGVGEKGLVKAGKMPWGGASFGVGDEFIKPEEIRLIAKAGADIIMVPAPGTVPGLTIELVKTWIGTIKEQGLLAEVTIGTSQEGAAAEVIGRIGIDSKMTGADLYQIGDGVYSGVATKENVFMFATAIKGIRHTLRRAAISPLRE